MRDTFHLSVRRALEKEGWLITHDPFPLPFAGVNLQVDLGAESVLGAEKAEQRIAVEVKSFIGSSPIHDLQAAVGQYLMYLEAMIEHEPERVVWLAVPSATWASLFVHPRVQALVAKYQVRVIVYNPNDASIESWKS